MWFSWWTWQRSRATPFSKTLFMYSVDAKRTSLQIYELLKEMKYWHEKTPYSHFGIIHSCCRKEYLNSFSAIKVKILYINFLLNILVVLRLSNVFHIHLFIQFDLVPEFIHVLMHIYLDKYIYSFILDIKFTCTGQAYFISAIQNKLTHIFCTVIIIFLLRTVFQNYIFCYF